MNTVMGPPWRLNGALDHARTVSRLTPLVAANFRTAIDNISRDTPDAMKLIPIRVPTTHSLLIGQCAQIRHPSKIVMIASKSTHPHPGCGRIWNASTRAKTPYTSRMQAMINVNASRPPAGMHQDENSRDDVQQSQQDLEHQSGRHCVLRKP